MKAAKRVRGLSLAVPGVLSLWSGAAVADEGGVSVWLPGTFGSLVALPQTPGLSLGTFYYHTTVRASGGVSRSREFTIGTLNPTLNLNLSAKLKADVDFI